jgi:hypothetical protein
VVWRFIVIVGLAPALQSSVTDVHETLKEGSRGSTAGPHRLLPTSVSLIEPWYSSQGPSPARGAHSEVRRAPQSTPVRNPRRWIFIGRPYLNFF